MRQPFLRPGETFGLTVTALCFTVAGVLGYDLRRTVGQPYGQWAQGVVGCEIALGMLFGIAAALAWRHVLRRATEHQ